MEYRRPAHRSRWTTRADKTRPTDSRRRVDTSRRRAICAGFFCAANKLDWPRDLSGGSQQTPGTREWGRGHRFVWDLHYERPRVFGYDHGISAIHDKDALLKPQAPQAVPSVYNVSLSVGDKTLHAAPLRLRMDPRVDAPAEAVEQATAFAREIHFEGPGVFRDVP